MIFCSSCFASLLEESERCWSSADEMFTHSWLCSCPFRTEYSCLSSGRATASKTMYLSLPFCFLLFLDISFPFLVLLLRKVGRFNMNSILISIHSSVSVTGLTSCTRERALLAIALSLLPVHTSWCFHLLFFLFLFLLLFLPPPLSLERIPKEIEHRVPWVLLEHLVLSFN